MYVGLFLIKIIAMGFLILCSLFETFVMIKSRLIFLDGFVAFSKLILKAPKSEETFIENIGIFHMGTCRHDMSAQV